MAPSSPPSSPTGLAFANGRGSPSVTPTDVDAGCLPRLFQAADLFAAICTEDKVRAYTQSECKIDPKVGGEFSLFSGNVTGVFQELEPGKRIKQAWRFKHWPASHFSEVTLTITELEDKCKLELRQTNVPEADKESTENGWRTHQWERMKAILGFGSGLSFGF